MAITVIYEINIILLLQSYCAKIY